MGAPGSSLRIAVVGGGPAGSSFALYALAFAQQARREVAITLYECKDFRRHGQPGCNMCAGIVPAPVIDRLTALGITLPPGLIQSRINTYTLHTSACQLTATQPDRHAEIVSVYRGAGPRFGHPPDLIGLDELLLEAAIARGARRCASVVEAIRYGQPMEVVSGGASVPYDLVVLATGVNGSLPVLQGLDYRPPPTRTMCQTELYLGQEEVQRRLSEAVHIFLPPDDIATYGILIPKGRFVTVSLLNARQQMRSLQAFLALPEVASVLGPAARSVCGCLPRLSRGLASTIAATGFVAVGDASATRLYKNGIGSALTTAERAAWTAINVGCDAADFKRHYLPLCRAIDYDNWFGRLLFLEVPLLKHWAALPQAHCRIATTPSAHVASALQTRVLWGMFTGAYAYRDLARMALAPGLVARWTWELARTTLGQQARG